MNSITEIINFAPPQYLDYFSKKTNFLISSGFGRHDKTRWLWRQIVRNYEFKAQYNALTAPEKKTLAHLLESFCRLPFADEQAFHLEKKVSWIFKHPAGGIFIPLEIVKLLMQEEQFQKQYYLFSLLYKIKLKEQNILASLTGGTLEGQLAISFEKNPLDMGLVLYIWFSSKIRSFTNSKLPAPRKGRLISSPYTFTREDINGENNRNQGMSEILPPKPVNLWDYLFQNFPHLKEDTERAFTLMAEGKKGFYRSLNLINNSENEYITLFKQGLLFPILTGGVVNAARIKKIQVVSPAEVRHHFRDSIKGAKSKKKF